MNLFRNHIINNARHFQETYSTVNILVKSYEIIELDTYLDLLQGNDRTSNLWFAQVKFYNRVTEDSVSIVFYFKRFGTPISNLFQGNAKVTGDWDYSRLGKSFIILQASIKGNSCSDFDPRVNFRTAYTNEGLWKFGVPNKQKLKTIDAEPNKMIQEFFADILQYHLSISLSD